MRRRSPYPYWFVLPGAVVFAVLFLVPTFASFWFSLTRWDLFTASFIGLENFRQFFSEPFLLQGLVNTLIYAVVTSGTKTVLGLLLAVLLTSGIFAQGFLRTVIFFPVLVSFIGIGFTFTALMHPTRGAINVALEAIGIDGPGLAHQPVARALLGRARRPLEGRRARDPHLHRRPRHDQPRLLRGRAHRSARPAGRCSGGSPCRWCGPRPSPSSPCR